MRREHIKTESYIDWLKDLGCLVYLPLSSDGDLQDRIGGLSLQFSGQGSMVWDGNQQRYKLTTPSQNNSHTAILPNGLTKSNFPDNRVTILQGIKKVTSSSSKYLRAFCVNSTNYDTTDVFNCGYNGTSRSNGFPASEVYLGFTINASIDRSYYQNGSLFGTYSPHNPYLPSNWVLNGSGVIIGNTTGSTSFTNVQLYISELYIFNNVLDLATIRKIQGYE